MARTSVLSLSTLFSLVPGVLSLGRVAGAPGTELCCAVLFFPAIMPLLGGFSRSGSFDLRDMIFRNRPMEPITVRWMVL